MDLTMWGPWAQDLVGALLKLRQGDSSTRFVGRYVRNKKMSKKLKIFKSSILCKRSVQFSWVNHIRGGGIGGGWRGGEGGRGEGYKSICKETICTGISMLHQWAFIIWFVSLLVCRFIWQLICLWKILLLENELFEQTFENKTYQSRWFEPNSNIRVLTNL